MVSNFAPIDPNEIAAFHQLLAAPQVQQQQRKGNFLTHLLPTGFGIGGGVAGGAAGGALAGSAVLPGVGTVAGGLLGALLGGAAGGGAGKAVENKVEGNPLGSGVAGQALEQGVLSAGPIRLLRGVGAGAKALAGVGGNAAGDVAAQGGSKLVNALNAAGEAASKPGAISRAKTAISNKGAQVEARAGGFGVGEKAPGGVQLGTGDSKNIVDTLRANGISPGSSENRLAAVESKLKSLGQQIDTHLNTSNAQVTPASAKQISSDFLTSVEGQAGVTPGVRKWAQNYADNFEKQVTDTKSLVNFRRQLDNQVINFNQNPQGSLVDKQLAARAFRDVLSNTTDKMAPGIADLNHSYSSLLKAQDFLKGGAKAVSDQSQGGGGVISRLLTNDTAQAGKSHLGGAMQRLGETGPASPFSAKAITARSLPVGVVQAAPAAMPQAVNTNSTANMMSDNTIQPSIDSLSQNQPDLSSAAPTSPFDASNVEANIQKMVSAGATDKNVSDYVNLVSAIQGIQQNAQGGGSKPMSATAATALGNVETGLQALQDYQGIVQQNPGALQRSLIPGRSLAGGYLGRALGTQPLDAARQQIVDIIARLRTGAAISKTEETRFNAFLPSAGDTPAVAAQKLKYLQSEFSNIAQRVNGSSAPSAADITSNPDLMNALGISQ